MHAFFLLHGNFSLSPITPATRIDDAAAAGTR
jgi:hypothetical protein